MGCMGRPRTARAVRLAASSAGRDRHRRALPWRGAQFARRDLAAFLHAFRGRVHSVHEDTGVSVHGYVEQPAPWALDRIDQLTLPLDGAYRYNGLGSGVNVYVVDTVRPNRNPIPLQGL